MSGEQLGAPGVRFDPTNSVENDVNLRFLRGEAAGARSDAEFFLRKAEALQDRATALDLQANLLETLMNDNQEVVVE